MRAAAVTALAVGLGLIRVLGYALITLFMALAVVTLVQRAWISENERWLFMALIFGNLGWWYFLLASLQRWLKPTHKTEVA